MAKTISWQRSCLWLSCCWTLAACTPWTAAAAAASHLVQMSPTPPAVVMVVRGDGPRPLPDPGSGHEPEPTQRSADSTFTHPHRNPTVVLAQTPEAATESPSAVNNTPTAPATNATPSTPSPPPPAEAQTTVASSPSSIPSGALPTPTPPPPPTAPTPSTPTTTQPDESSSPTLLPPAANETAPVPSSAPPASAGKPTVKTQARSSTVKEEEPPLCDIDPCVHLQQPCPELKEAKGWSCTCPGARSGGPSTAPGPVVALEVTRVWPRAAGVRWCAPYSTLTSFLVWVLRQQDGSVAVSNASVSSRARRTDVFGLEAGHAYILCVSARNGASAASHARCVPVATPRDGEAIALYVLAGGCAALLLTAAVLSVCLHRQCERGRAASGGAPPAALLNNPTAAAQMALHVEPRLASLVSIANPAYAHPEERAPCTGVNAYQHTHGREQTNAHHTQPKKSTNVNRK